MVLTHGSMIKLDVLATDTGALAEQEDDDTEAEDCQVMIEWMCLWSDVSIAY